MKNDPLETRALKQILPFYDGDVDRFLVGPTDFTWNKNLSIYVPTHTLSLAARLIADSWEGSMEDAMYKQSEWALR